jgi:hypothetical protein
VSPDLCELEANKTKDSIIILNVLDNCFGHSLLKLFFSIKYIEEKKDYDFLVIVPKALKHFLKNIEGLSVLYIDLPFSKFEKCYILNKEISKVTKNYKEILIEGAETYNSFDFNLLKNKLNLLGNYPVELEKRKIIFYYRKDYYRTWGGTKQRKKIIDLFSFLKAFFEDYVEFYIVGDLDDREFPHWIKDVRTDAFSKETDFHYNSLFASCLICIGLTGSHMLFPSLFSLCTIHLHPVFKYKNMAEDIVVNDNSNEMLSAYKHLYYFGNHNCSNISSFILGRLIIFHFSGLLEKEYKISSTNMSQKEWLNELYPSFLFSKSNYFRIKQNRFESFKTQLNRKINSIFMFKKL